MHRLRGVVAALVGLVLATSIAPPARAAAEPVIPDPALRACLASALKTQTGTAELTAAGLAKLGYVFCDAGTGVIRDLTGVAYLTSAGTLVVRDTQVSDLRPIESMPILNTFGVGTDRAFDPAPILNAFFIESLAIWSRAVSGLEFLRAMPQLKALQLDVAPTADLRPIGSLSELQRLTFTTHAGQSLDPLLDLSLDFLTLMTRATRFPTIGRPIRVPYLSIMSSPNLTTLDGLELVSADFIAVNVPRLTDVSALSGMPAIELFVTGTRGLDLRPISRMSTLKKLGLPDNGITDISVLASLPKSVHLDLNQNAIHDFSPLKGWTGTVSGFDQTIALPDAYVKVPYPIAFKDVSGRYLKTDAWTASLYRDGKLIYPARGTRTLHFMDRMDGRETIRIMVTQTAILKGKLSKTPTPVLRHTGKVVTDRVLTVTPGTWDAGVTLKYQWQRNQKDIRGATGTTYKVQAVDVGDGIRVRVTGSRTGFDSVAKYSRSVTPGRATFGNRSVPTIAGTRAVGSKLTARVTWTPKAALKYRWYRDNKLIKGAARSSYTLKASDLGRRIRVKVTATKPGYATLVKTSAATGKITKRL